MARPLLVLGALAVTALGGGTGEARRLGCEGEPEGSLLARARTDDDSAPRLPMEHAVCVAGLSGDPSCWDHQAVPQPGRGVLLAFSDLYMQGSRAPLLAPP